MTHTKSIAMLGVTWLVSLFSTPPAFSADAPATKAKHRSAITISKETTRITEPVNELGYVDYVAAINQQTSRGVTPKNNAAVLLWEAYGKKPLAEHLKPESVAKFYELLGVDMPEADEGYYVPMGEFVKRMGFAPKDQEFVLEELYNDQESALDRPWTPKEFTQLDAWLRANEKCTKIVVEASKRTRYYVPAISEEIPPMLGTAIHGYMENRDVARILVLRSMQLTAAGKHDEAWSHLIACWRLARHVSQGPSLIDSLVAMSIESIAVHGTIQFVCHAKLTDEQVDSIRVELGNLPARKRIPETIDHLERYCFLDAIQSIEEHGFSLLSADEMWGGIGVNKPEKPGIEKAIKRIVLRTVIDWNFIMRGANKYYDQMVAIAHMPRGKQRDEANDAFLRDMRDRTPPKTDIRSFCADVASGKTPRRVVSERVSDYFFTMLLPALMAASSVEDRANMTLEMLDTAFALKLYHNKHGEYPEKLASIVPKYLKAIPVDIYAEDAPVRYKKTAKGYLLYSVGMDAIDQGGPSDDDESDSDDHGFRVPASS